MTNAQKTEQADLHQEVGDTIGEPFVDPDRVKMAARNVDIHYGDKQAIFNNNLDIGKNEVLAMIGPSGCGKSTFLRALNRMNDTISICRVTGDITLDGEDIYDKSMDPVLLRARIGMVFQKPNPFPKSIYDNVAYGPKLHGLARNKSEMDEIVVTSLQRAGLWDEVKDRMDDQAPVCRAVNNSACVSPAPSRSAPR